MANVSPDYALVCVFRENRIRTLEVLEGESRPEYACPEPPIRVAGGGGGNSGR
jgi:hypothetical protein